MFKRPTFFRRRYLRTYRNVNKPTAKRVAITSALLGIVLAWSNSSLVWATDAGKPPVSPIRIERGHPWRPPFGLQRVGRPPVAVVQLPHDAKTAGEYALAAYRGDEQIGRWVLPPANNPPAAHRVALPSWPTELVLSVRTSPQAEPDVLARKGVEPPAFEAEAVAQPETIVNPVDLGTVLVPADWLLLAGGQWAEVDVAAISYARAIPQGQVVAWFDSAPQQKVSAPIRLAQGRRAEAHLRLPPGKSEAERDRLHVSIVEAGGAPLWQKTTPTMRVAHPPRWPRFGATRTKLRFDPPISIRKADGTFTSMPYKEGWAPDLTDVVVSLPNGSRFVFWRGSSYVPFWAGRYNTGLSYEWAENLAPPADRTDCVEPLMDKQLRYGRVQVVESTAARVHVRWSYQSCDFHYKVWGDSAVEDFYFYPDGFGTRVLTLQSSPGADYELSEFIILAPQAAYPLAVLPSHLVDAIFLDGKKREIVFPCLAGSQAEVRQSRDMPAIYRVRLNNKERLAAVYFNPRDRRFPPVIFGPFYDHGQLVTPAYWGSHWPLARGNATGNAIDQRIALTPSHNSLMSWAHVRPQPVWSVTRPSVDTLGRSRPMSHRRWVWLIGMSADDDGRLLEWAGSFGRPPVLTVEGGRMDSVPYSPQRRAHRLVVEKRAVAITIQPTACCVNPVFELEKAPPVLARIQLAGRPLKPREYAWDGHTLWLDATIRQKTLLRLEFADRDK